MYTDRIILIVKIQKLLISYTRFFLDVLILEDGAHKVSCNVSNKLPIDVHNIPLDQRIHKLVRNMKRKKKIPYLTNFK